MCIYMYIYIFIYEHVHMHIYLYIYTYIYLYTYISCMDIYIYIYIYYRFTHMNTYHNNVKILSFFFCLSSSFCLDGARTHTHTHTHVKTFSLQHTATHLQKRPAQINTYRSNMRNSKICNLIVS